MKHLRALCVLAGVALAATLALPGAQRFASFAADGDAAELPTLRRIQVPAERLAAELERVKQGVLVQMPRSEFEAKWERASKAATAQQNPPRLIEARYSAVLTDVSLTRGTGQWRVLNPGNAPGILGIQPLNLALQNARLQQPSGNGEAILGDLDGKSLGLLVGRRAHRDSSTGRCAPAWTAFADLRVPACGVHARAAFTGRPRVAMRYIPSPGRIRRDARPSALAAGCRAVAGRLRFDLSPAGPRAAGARGWSRVKSGPTSSA